MSTSEKTRGERAPRGRDSLVSTQVNDFVIEERIGEGGMGVVYRAVHPLIGKQVAIKVLRAENVTQQQVERLLIEARSVNAIRHPGIIDIFGFGTLPDGRPYIIMELLRGQSLAALLQQNTRLDPNTTVWILDQMLSALGAAHEAGVVHRDLKPGNVFLAQGLDGTRTVKLVDFGIAKLMRSADGPTTVDGTILGTPEYMAPEQVRGNTVSFATDLYATGVMAFHMLTGERPFKGEQLQVLFAHIEQPPPLPSSRVPGLPAEFDTLILHLLAKDPALRPESAEAVRQALKRIPPTVLSAPATVPLPAQLPVPESRTKTTASQVRPMLPGVRWSRGSTWAVGGALITSVALGSFFLGSRQSSTTSTATASQIPAREPQAAEHRPPPSARTETPQAMPDPAGTVRTGAPQVARSEASPEPPPPSTLSKHAPATEKTEQGAPTEQARVSALTESVTTTEKQAKSGPPKRAAAVPASSNKRQGAVPAVMSRHPQAFLAQNAKAPLDATLLLRVYQLEERYLKQTSGSTRSTEFEQQLESLHARALSAKTRSEVTKVSTALSALSKDLPTFQAAGSASDTTTKPNLDGPPPHTAAPSPTPQAALRAPGPQFLAMLTTPALTPDDEGLARRLIHLKAVYLERASKREYPKLLEDLLVRIHDLSMKAKTPTTITQIHDALDGWEEVLNGATPK
ncbi:protein kinase [Myxococcus sp. MISCRS1]|uniref:serine/threonine-protein kinase n=1 Tax=Myxococcus sp. MISCRS1 TaxID=2996786 RepID=UPI00226E82B4|nr:serine/threonine-protein kinase [Myxococcus sp. MISCRS1]MCY0999591.1 protein kinase [Myxococcus sp. MISCRS1]